MSHERAGVASVQTGGRKTLRKQERNCHDSKYL
jgi:hypothetical protein